MVRSLVLFSPEFFSKERGKFKLVLLSAGIVYEGILVRVCVSYKHKLYTVYVDEIQVSKAVCS